LTCTGDGRGAERDLVFSSEVKRPIGRYRRRSEDNIKIDIQEIEWGVCSGLS
jgi:hypothetical protein